LATLTEDIGRELAVRLAEEYPAGANSAYPKMACRYVSCSCAGTRLSVVPPDLGKFGIVNVILAALAACRDVVISIWGVDLNGGMELQPWTTCIQCHFLAEHRQLSVLRGC
jgi:hypothetical protein